jgi:hypothetical protein
MIEIEFDNAQDAVQAWRDELRHIAGLKDELRTLQDIQNHTDDDQLKAWAGHMIRSIKHELAGLETTI